MTGISTLLLPILLSAVVVFILSSLVHMVLPWHKNDYDQVPNEDRVMETMRSLAIPPGDYLMPRPSSRQDMSSAEFKEKVAKGPVMMFTVAPSGGIQMGKNLVLWFIYTVVVSLLAAYVAGRALPPGTDYIQVFRFVGTTAFIGYSVALWQNSIWGGRKWSTTVKSNVDGLIYALFTAGVFGWLWP